MNRKNCYTCMHPEVYEGIREIAKADTKNINDTNDEIAQVFISNPCKPVVCFATPRPCKARSNWISEVLFDQLEALGVQYKASTNQVWYTACVLYLQTRGALPPSFRESLPLLTGPSLETFSPDLALTSIN